MVTWEQFEKWLRDHDLPTTTVLRIELVPVQGGEIHLRAECVKLNDAGCPIVRQNGSQPLTEMLMRPLVYLPGQQPPEGAE